MKSRSLALLLLVAGTAFAGNDFDGLVNAVEHYYGVKQTHVPLMGVANLFLKVAHPAGASGFHLAIFEDLPDDDRNFADLNRFIQDYCRGGMHPLVVTHSRVSDEATFILTGEVGKNTKVLIATFERHEATVVEAEVNIETLMKMIHSPGDAHKLFKEKDEEGY